MKNFIINTCIILSIILISLNILHLFLYSDITTNAIVISDELNIRTIPSISDEKSVIITTLHQNDALEFLGIEKETRDGYTWARVKIKLEDGSIEKGYCVYKYILIEEEPSKAKSFASVV